MDKFKRGLSLHKKKDIISESNKPYLWQEDEKKVREGTCSFQVKYLGCIEVFESRGIQICEEAINLLRNSKSKPQRAVLYVAGDALRVVDELSKGLIVDQTIEKVSFCAPDRNNDKGFAYICRDGTTRRWMCHGFMAVKESGERLSHAVGCAFTICLEKKQLREKEKMTVTYSENGGSTLTRTGSFRPATLIERLADPQSAIVAEPVPLKKTDNPFAVERPKAPVDLLHRQGSFSGFTRLSETSSPFKRQMSLRLDELPSTRNRHEELTGEYGNVNHNCQQTSIAISPIAESSPSIERTDCISQICQQLSHGLIASKKPSTAPDVNTGETKPRDALEVIWKQPVTGQWNQQVQPVVENDHKVESPSNGGMKAIPHSVPLSVVETSSVTSEAESWLNAIRDGMRMPPSTGSPANGTVATEPMATVHGTGLGYTPRQQPLSAEINACSNINSTSFVSPFSSILFRTTSLEHSGQSANVDRQQSASQVGVASFMSNSWGSVSTSGSSQQGPRPSDPFDAEWAKMAANNARNPFIGGAISNSFELRL